MIELKHISKTFPTADGVFQALDDINLTIRDGDIFGIVGMSGAGKSTLVRCINLLERPTEGQVVIDGRDLCAMTEKELMVQRRSISMIFQHYNLVYRATAIENVLLAAWAKGIGSCWLSAPQRMGFGPAFQRRFAPDKGEFVAAVTLGYPDQQPKMPPRRDGRYLIV